MSRVWLSRNYVVVATDAGMRTSRVRLDKMVLKLGTVATLFFIIIICGDGRPCPPARWRNP